MTSSAKHKAASADRTNNLSSRLPRHLQISELLTREIQAGVLRDGQRLPPERDLAQSLDVSVGTLRRALLELQMNGLLKRVQGSGNYVQAREDVASVYTLFRLELKTGGGLPSAHLLSCTLLHKPDDLPSFGTSDQAFRFRRERFLNDQLAAMEEIWLDASYADRIDAQDVSESLYLFYKTRLGFWITQAEDRVSVHQLPEWAALHLGLEPSTQWGYVERWSRDQEHRIAEFSRTWFDPEHVRFVSR